MVEVSFRAVIEVLGKPKEHVENAMKEYIDNLKKDDRFKIYREEFAEIKKQESEMWATFAELELKTEDIQHLISFCFEYMPSVLEVLSPSEIKFSERGMSEFLNDLQAKLHQVDMVAKQIKMENEGIQLNTNRIIRNYLTILLNQGDLTLTQMSKLTGVAEEKIGDYLDKLIDDGYVIQENDLYKLNKDKPIKKEDDDDGIKEEG